MLIIPIVLLIALLSGGSVSSAKKSRKEEDEEAEVVQSSLSLLTPQAANAVKALVDELHSKGFKPIIYETLRTQERQKALYAIGRRGVPNEKPVTWTLNSNHADGNAADLIDGRSNPETGKILGWSPAPGEEAPGTFFLEIEKLAPKYGLRTIGRETGDWAHVELANNVA